jgi:hypothetical protein
VENSVRIIGQKIAEARFIVVFAYQQNVVVLGHQIAIEQVDVNTRGISPPIGFLFALDAADLILFAIQIYCLQTWAELFHFFIIAVYLTK